MLAEKEGVFVEPASAASVAGLFKLKREGFFSEFTKKNKEINIVCTLTGHGLKDPQLAVEKVKPPKAVEATVQAVAKMAAISKK
jgi:threonine synthase